jgi:hypothetical protein
VRNILCTGVSLFAPLTLLIACEGTQPIEPPPPVPDSCDGVTNALDRALCSELYDTGYRPLLGSEAEVCGRLYVDMLGVRATSDQLRTECMGSPVDAVIDRLQQMTSYRIAQRRYWGDRLSYSDALVDPGSIRDLDALVDDLYQEKISYRDFAIRALAHPGFVGRHNGYGQPDMVAQAAFKAFLGRPATRPEAQDVGNLWRSWISNFQPFDGAAREGNSDRIAVPGGGLGGEPAIDPTACAAGVQVCESTLLGYAKVAFPANGRNTYIPIADLTAEDWEALRSPGYLFVGLDSFWEAEVDDTLKRLLGYDLGALRPNARQALVELFKQNGGNVRQLEKIVLSSWAYRQTALEVEGSPRPEALREIPFAYGPTKLMTAEAWLHSISSVIGRSLGDCDWRYANMPDYGLPPEAVSPLADVYPRNPDGTFDLTFRNAARLLGGCPGAFDFGSFSVTGRTSHIGLITAVAQEEELTNVCFLSDVPALMPPGLELTDTSVDAIDATAQHVLDRMQIDQTNPAVSEVVETVMTECPDCNVEDVARGLCSGLLGGIQFLTY